MKLYYKYSIVSVHVVFYYWDWYYYQSLLNIDNEIFVVLYFNELICLVVTLELRLKIWGNKKYMVSFKQNVFVWR